MTTILDDIAAHAPYTGADLVPCEITDEYPVEAFFGTIFARSSAGTLIEFYSYYDSDYKPDAYIFVERGYPQKIIQATFHVLKRLDKIFFKSWEDFTMYDTENFHRVLRYLIKNGFELCTRSQVG